MKAWHFLREDKKLGYDDGRLVRRGHTFKCDPDKLELCEYGFHGSKRIIDALKFSPGPVVCRVELSGRIIECNDKIVASKRTVLQMGDATNVLHEFACRVAEEALSKIKNPDPRSLAAIGAKRAWLRGDISEAELSAAWSAAWAAASAAWSAASSAASSAEWSAAWAAASVARSAAWRGAWRGAVHAAWNAAWNAAASAEWRGAVHAAAGAAAGAQNKLLTEMVEEVLK